jgi:hypothetical protein
MDILAIILEERENIGYGQYGNAIKKGNKVYKITESVHEYALATKIYKSNYNFEAFPKIYGTRKLDKGKFLIIREYYNEISNEFGELIGENFYNIIDYFSETTFDVRKSQTNLDYEFDDKFLNFLDKLKYELIKILKYKWNEFDIDGMANNIGLDKNGNYRLFDF